MISPGEYRRIWLDCATSGFTQEENFFFTWGAILYPIFWLSYHFSHHRRGLSFREQIELMEPEILKRYGVGVAL